jgi:hypothetical protein
MLSLHDREDVAGHERSRRRAPETGDERNQTLHGNCLLRVERRRLKTRTCTFSMISRFGRLQFLLGHTQLDNILVLADMMF